MKLKICGMARQEDLYSAAEAGFNFCGFIFHAKSPRHIEPAVVARLDSGPMRRVGVFVKQDATEIAALMKEARLDLAQLHGAQTVADAMRIGPERVIRVLWPMRYANQARFMEDAAKYGESCVWYLLDAGLAGGGSGQSVNAGLLRNLQLPKPWFLAGGVGPGNAQELLEFCKPDGLDCNSALESAPGIKDKEKIFALARQINGRNG